MKPISELDAIRQHGILASLAGFPILLVFAFVWIAAGALSYVVPRELAHWVYVFIGLPAMPLAILLERRMGYVRPAEPDPLLPLGLQVLFVQVVAFPAIVLVADVAPAYMPVAFAAVVGAHFLPFQWIYRTRIYGFLAVAVAVGPYVLALFVGPRVLHFTGFLVGAILFVGALLVRSHAKATWIASGQGASPNDAAGGGGDRIRYR